MGTGRAQEGVGSEKEKIVEEGTWGISRSNRQSPRSIKEYTCIPSAKL
jgi:hypothetical protein